MQVASPCVSKMLTLSACSEGCSCKLLRPGSTKHSVPKMLMLSTCPEDCSCEFLRPGFTKHGVPCCLEAHGGKALTGKPGILVLGVTCNCTTKMSNTAVPGLSLVLAAPGPALPCHALPCPALPCPVHCGSQASEWGLADQKAEQHLGLKSVQQSTLASWPAGHLAEHKGQLQSQLFPPSVYGQQQADQDCHPQRDAALHTATCPMEGTHVGAS